jgi:NTF2 fold immunity protein
MRKATTMLLAAAVVLACGAIGPQDAYVPVEGYVPTADVAIKIAVAVWEPIFGAQAIAEEKPYKATLAEGVWTVEGTLPKRYKKGGVALAEISKRDGRILRVAHGK